jgi:hypothetical protein
MLDLSALLQQLLLGEKLGWGPVGHSVRLRGGVGSTFSRERWICPTLLSQCERFLRRGTVCKKRMWTGVESVCIVCIRFSLQGCRGNYPRYRGRQLWPKTFEYGQFPLVTNGWGVIHPVRGNNPTSPGWRDGATTDLIETNLGNKPRHHFFFVTPLVWL